MSEQNYEDTTPATGADDAALDAQRSGADVHDDSETWAGFGQGDVDARVVDAEDTGTGRQSGRDSEDGVPVGSADAEADAERAGADESAL